MGMKWIVVILSLMLSFQINARELEIVPSSGPVRLVYADLFDLDGLRIGMTISQIEQLYDQKYPGSHLDIKLRTGLVGQPTGDLTASPYIEWLRVIGTHSTVSLAARLTSPALGSIAVLVQRHQHWALPSEGPSVESVMQLLNKRFGDQPGSIGEQVTDGDSIHIDTNWVFGAHGLLRCDMQDCEDLVHDQPENLNTKSFQARLDANHFAVVEAFIRADVTGSHVRDLTIAIEDVSNELRDGIELDKQLIEAARGAPGSLGILPRSDSK